MERDEIEALIRGVVDRTHTIDEAVGVLLNEMGRGGRIFVVDENLMGLERELSQLNYTTYTVSPHLDDQLIKEQVRGRVLVTGNGRHFVDDVGQDKGNYGLIWVTSQKDHQVLAGEIAQAIQRVNFRRNLNQVVKV